LDEELDILLQEGRKRHAVDIEQHSEFSTSWLYQVRTLWEREMIRHWRDPTYLVAKLALNVVAGLFIGFTFFKAKDTIQGTQNHIFVSHLPVVSRRFLVSLILACRRSL
jgi:ATP-binding cassette subfamily G (WHITE) protein 2 (SNQ2)